jgi:hypothetical protein
VQQTHWSSHSATVPNKPRLGCRSSIFTKFSVPQHGIYSIALYLWTYLTELKLTDGPTLMGTNLAWRTTRLCRRLFRSAMLLMSSAQIKIQKADSIILSPMSMAKDMMGLRLMA